MVKTRARFGGNHEQEIETNFGYNTLALYPYAVLSQTFFIFFSARSVVINTNQF